MSRFNFCGASYQSPILPANAELSLNLIPEQDQSGDGKSGWIMLPTPALNPFAAIGGAQNRGGYLINGRLFSVVDGTLWEVTANGGTTNRGVVANDFQRVTMVGTSGASAQLAIASGGNLYVLNVITNALQQIAAATFSGPVLRIAYDDGFFIALIGPNPATNTPAQFYVSNIGDATSWNLNGSKHVSTYPENTLSMLVDHREIFLPGSRASEFEFDSGNTFPFDTSSGGFTEQGIIAPDSLFKVDNAFMWLGGNADQGQGIFWRINGYTPQRISDHSIEYELTTYPRVDDARGFCYQRGGHTFAIWYFPTANKTVCYDVATQRWSHRQFGIAQPSAWRAQWHQSAFGLNLVGDWNSGNVYQLSDTTFTDFGNPILRLRRAPIIAKENKRVFFSRLDVDVETGLGPQPPLLNASGQARGPILSLRWTDDGKTWSSYWDRDCGQAGQYKKRVFWSPLGSSLKGRIFELSGADPVPYKFIDAYLEGDNFQSNERLVHQLRKTA